jgi:hypothetical protein
MNTTNCPETILLFNSVLAEEQFRGRPGVAEWSMIRKIWGHNGSLIDRSGVVSIPFKTSTLDSMRLPTLPKTFSKTLEEVCYERARSILDSAVSGNKTISILWSGGIDSTCTVTSFLMAIKPHETNLLTILLNKESILENPRFFRNYLVGKVNCKDSNVWQRYISNDNIFVTGEGGDQVCWNGFTRSSDRIFNELGWDYLRKPATLENVVPVLEQVSQDRTSAIVAYNSIISPLKNNSVVPVDSVGQILWYFNFTCKWQNVYLRTLNNLVNTEIIDSQYISDNFMMFYESDDIQIWTMLNNESTVWVKKFTDIKNPLKQVIYRFDRDKEYFENKVKFGSLGRLSRMRPSIGYITSNWRFTDFVDTDQFYNPENSFI